MANKKRKKIRTDNIVNEPELNYKTTEENRRIHFFSSFEEMENDNYKYWANLTPEQHLQNVTSFLEKIFSKEIKRNPTLGKRIYFS